MGRRIDLDKTGERLNRIKYTSIHVTLIYLFNMIRLSTANIKDDEKHHEKISQLLLVIL